MTKQIHARVFQRRNGLKTDTRSGRKPIRLLSDRGYVLTGSCYMTRVAVRRLLNRETTRAVIRNDGSQRYPKRARLLPARVTNTRLRIGCHVWSGHDFVVLRDWALA